MDVTIKGIIEDYVNNVNDACKNLIKGINKQEKLELKTKYQFFNYMLRNGKTEYNVNGVTYKLHGKGCFAIGDNFFLNWDYGYRSRWCGVDPYKIALTLKENKSTFNYLFNGEIIKNACEQAVMNGEMFCRNHLFYFNPSNDEMIKPNFPIDYDSLIIEDYQNKWILKRTKEIDRFIRKSNTIHNKIFESTNAYTLSFFLNGKEVYSIPYDDICYPEKAIEIMTDNIIRNIDKYC